MSGTLFVVATPIGNLEDVTLRALRILREVDLIAAEDTRRTAKLLTHHGISTPTLSFHAHNTRSRLPQLMTRLRAGDSIALVSDAGTPGVSDPGEELVRACVEERIAVDPIPGATAPLAAVLASGFPILPLTVFGFAPARAKDRTKWLAKISSLDHTSTFFESPQRIATTLLEASTVLGTRPIMVGRELTKIHQEFAHGTCLELSERFKRTKGELTVVISPNTQAPASEPTTTDRDIAAEFWSKAKSWPGSRRELIAELAAKFNVSSKEIYSIVEKSKTSTE
jgi:16S rRNA (cytidine1402-2'-O)-methyltransferase